MNYATKLQKIGGISALSIIELKVEAKRLEGKAFDVCVKFEVNRNQTLNGQSANKCIILQAHELTDVVCVR